MAQRARLTKSLIDRLKYLGAGNEACITWDTAMPGFGVRVYPSGRKAFVHRYKAGARRRTITLGAVGVLTLQEARHEAQRNKVDIVRGEDPLQVRKRERGGALTFNEFADEYLEKHAFAKKKRSSASGDERNLANHVRPHLGAMALVDIRNDDIRVIHHAMRGRPYAANRTLALLSKMFNLAEAWEYRPPHSNPCRGVQKFREKRRDNFLSRDQLARLGQAIAKAEADGAYAAAALDAIKFLLFSGCRKSEVLTLKWYEVDMENAALRLGDTKTGARTVYLSAQAIEVLESRRAQRSPSDPYVFPGRDGGHLVNVKRSWAHLCAAAQLHGARIHDLRHTFASYAAMSGVSLGAIGQLLGHSQYATTQMYAHWASDARQRAAAQVGDVLSAEFSRGTENAHDRRN